MKQFWIWPIALYLFLGGLGVGMMATAAVVGLIIAPSALTSGALVWGVFIAFLILGIGTGLLVFELGQPWIFYRAFVTRTSVIKWGAVFLSISMIAGVLFPGSRSCPSSRMRVLHRCCSALPASSACASRSIRASCFPA